MRSISALTQELEDSFSFHLVTRDRDLGESTPYDYPYRGTLVTSSAVIHYLPPWRLSPFGLWFLKERTFDTIYLQSIFSRVSSILPIWLWVVGMLRCKQLVIAPRGELYPSALAIHPFRKRLYLRLLRHSGLAKRLVWQATTPSEEKQIQVWFGNNVQRRMIPNLIGNLTPAALESRSKAVGELRLVWLSRISPNKNLERAIEIVKQAPAGVSLDIYGPVEDRKYWQSCSRLFQGDKRIHYKGALSPSDVHGTLNDYHALLFPTRGENFGFVVLEAMAAGCAVLVGSSTPWQAAEKSGACWCLHEDDADAYLHRIRFLADLNSTEFKQVSESARAYAMDMVARNGDIKEKLARMLEGRIT